MIKITLTNTDRGTGEITETNITPDVFAERFKDSLNVKKSFARDPRVMANLLQEFIESYNEPTHENSN